MTFIELLDSVRADLSKNMFSKKLHVSRTAVLSWYNDGVIPKDDALFDIAEYGNIPVEVVLLTAMAEKITNPDKAKLLRERALTVLH